jgi:hypothetical protein
MNSQPAHRRGGSVFETVKAVLWGFLGCAAMRTTSATSRASIPFT